VGLNDLERPARPILAKNPTSISKSPLDQAKHPPMNTISAPPKYTDRMSVKLRMAERRGKLPKPALIVTSKSFQQQVGQEINPVHGDGLLHFEGAGEVFLEQFFFQLRGERRVGRGNVLFLTEPQAHVVEIA
jgi:hypothetical protein